MIGYRLVWKLYFELELEEFASVLFSNQMNFIDTGLFMLFLADDHDLINGWLHR